MTSVQTNSWMPASIHAIRATNLSCVVNGGRAGGDVELEAAPVAVFEVLRRADTLQLAGHKNADALTKGLALLHAVCSKSVSARADS